MENRDSQGSSYERSYGGGAGGMGFRGPRPFRPSPVRVGEEYDVRIESMSKRGDTGVARVQGLVIFIADTKVGDSVRIKITKVGRGYATAEVASGQATAQQPAIEADELQGKPLVERVEPESESKSEQSPGHSSLD